MVMQYTEKEYRLAREGARDASKSSSLIEHDDLVGEAYLWLASHPKKVFEWRELGRKGENMLRISCKRSALKAVARERKRISGAEFSDMCFYSTQMIRELMPVIFNVADWSTSSAMSNEPRGQSAPAEGNNRLAMIVDVRAAYHDQAMHIQEFLQRMYDNPVPNVEDLIAVEEGVSTKTIQRRDERYLGFMVQYLGGDNPWEKAG